VNMDMVSRSEAGELYAAGTYHYPFLFPLVERVAERAPVTLLTGHDRPDLPPGDDWTLSSDHGAFHEVGIPFIYFGVEDHPGYHNPTDTFENITPEFYVRAVTTVLDFVREADAELAEIHAARMATVED
jgi:Zn-dependent M28 family amino/carboxypeptidase